MTYQETLKYILNAMPMYQRIGVNAYKADLENAYSLDDYFKHPHKEFKTIHIAGTNGKGSVCHMLAAVLQSAGFKTGLFTSPHLTDFRERIKVNGKEISKDFVNAFIHLHKEFFEKINPSFFEMSVFMAFEYFRQKKINIAVIETGLGGRLDTTNIITPEVSVITNISKDHIQILGNTIEQIAKEKAGIIKKNVPIVIGEDQVETRQIFLQYAQQAGSKIYFADEHFKVEYQSKGKNGLANYHFSVISNESSNTLSSDLTGIYQKKNICTAMMTLTILSQQGLNISEKCIKAGFSHVIKLTGLQGRWQEVSLNPLVVCDTGHNEAGIKSVLEQIKNTVHHELHMVLGFVSDKDFNAIIRLLPKNACYYLCQPNVPRAKNVNELQKEFIFFNLNSSAFIKVEHAFNAAIEKAGKGDLVFIGGSNFVVADFLKWKKIKKTF
jgi:dihydrofolate synthase / folylpolyglutamate synthase